MNIQNVTSTNAKGQLVIPVKLRRDLNITATTKLNVRKKGRQIIIEKIEDLPQTNQESLQEILDLTRGMWADTADEDRALEEKRHKLELQEAKLAREA